MKTQIKVLVLGVAGLAFAGCAQRIPKPRFPVQPEPQFAPLEWRREDLDRPSRFVAKPRTQSAGTTRVRLLEPADELFRCELPNGSSSTFRPERYGLVIEMTNQSDRVVVIDPTRTLAMLDTDNVVVHNVGNPVPAFIKALAGAKGLTDFYFLFAKAGARYAEIRQQVAQQKQEAREAEATAARARIDEQLSALKRAGADEKQIQLSRTQLEASMVDDRPTTTSEDNDVAALASQFVDLFDNPGRIALVSTVQAEFAAWSPSTKLMNTAELAQYREALSGIAPQWKRYRLDRKIRKESAEDMDIEAMIAGTRELETRGARERIEAAQDHRQELLTACLDKVRSAMNGYAEWPPQLLPGRPVRVFLFFIDASAYGPARKLSLVLYDLPSRVDRAGEIVERQTLRFELAMQMPRPTAP